VLGLSPLEDHLHSPRGRGRTHAHEGRAGGAACGDQIRISLDLRGDRVADAGFDASGCAAIRAAGSATVELLRDATLSEAALISTQAISDALDGLNPGRVHAAAFAADALHEALGHAALTVTSTPKPTRTIVAMSGGVDSAVAAQLALDAGHEVVAVTLKLWDDAATDGTRSCCSPQAVTVARALAHRMGIPHLTLDVRDGFRGAVVDDFIAEYAAGRTPNPCVRCNGNVRFDAMLALAQNLGAARLATGHYARTAYDAHGPLIRAAVDRRKDQSYMLARLKPEALRRIWFPLGELESKADTRAIAREHDLPVAEKPESQDLCFLAGTDPRAFLERHGALTDDPGDIRDEQGNRLGTHNGQHHFTIGQRRGIGVAAPLPLYVIDKDPQRNTVTVGPKTSLATTEVELEDVTLYRPADQVDRVKLRYHAEAAGCGLRAAGTRLSLENPVSGVAPGQTACLMRGDTVIGCGTIAVPLRREVANAG
jgi:tRNA-specific 2-thiouridylase